VHFDDPDALDAGGVVAPCGIDGIVSTTQSNMPGCSSEHEPDETAEAGRQLQPVGSRSRSGGGATPPIWPDLTQTIPGPHDAGLHVAGDALDGGGRSWVRPGGGDA
jgi:hypothetical protein